jgi:hypothetical protein
MLSVVMLSVVMLRVVAPYFASSASDKETKSFFDIDTNRPSVQGILTEGKGSVPLTSSLR